MIIDLIGWRASLTPKRPALFWKDRWYSYAELNERAQKLAAHLHRQGIKKDDRIAILALNHIAHLDLVLAAPKLGFIYTPFNYRLSSAEQKQLAAEIEPALLLHDEKHCALAEATGCRRLPLENYETWLHEESAAPSASAGGNSSFSMTPAAAPGASAGDTKSFSMTPDPEPAAPMLNGDDIHMILFTGGSTGLPKGALIPYRQVFFNAVNTAIAWGITENDCAIQATPAFHAALNVLATPLLFLGGRVVWAESFEPGGYLKLAEAHKSTILFMVPTMFQMLTEHPQFAGANLSQVRFAISGGAPCPPTVREPFAARGIRFKQGYGMTECGVNCFAISLDEAKQYPGAVGRPMPTLQAVIRTPDGAPVKPGEIGELTLSGPVVCAGYFNKPDETAESFRDGWLWTGDLARQDERGLYFICGRRKEMYISGGENIYPAEIEAALLQCAGVAECAVIGIAHPRWGETGLAAVSLRPDVRLNAESLRALLKPRLAGYKLPGEFLFLSDLPKTGAGKINKPEIRRAYEAQQTVRQSLTA